MLDPESLTLVAITDDLRDGIDGLVARATRAQEGGATMVQLRLKQVEARVLADVSRRLVATLAIPVIVNDRADVALATGAAGVHVGAEDLSPRALRRVVPAGFIIGASVGSDSESDDADGADYVGIGPVFDTWSKADAGEAIGIERFAALQARSARPAVAIGGLTPENARAVMTSGAHGVAVIRSLLGAHDPAAAARALRSAIGR